MILVNSDLRLDHAVVIMFAITIVDKKVVVSTSYTVAAGAMKIILKAINNASKLVVR